MNKNKEKKIFMKNEKLEIKKAGLVLIKKLGQKFSEAKTVTFTDLVTLRKNDKQKKLISIERKPIENDPFHIVEHWRTKFKFYNECCICGEQNTIAIL